MCESTLWRPCCRSVTVAALVFAFQLPIAYAQDAPAAVAVDRKILADNGVEGDQFGAAVAVDGGVMVIAAPNAGSGEGGTSGLVYVYLRDADTGEWREHQQLVPSQGHFEDNFLDMTLVVRGTTIVVGAPYADIDRFQEGAVYVFESDADGNWAQTARLVNAGVGSNGHFGTSVALDGDLLAVGSPQESLDRHGRVDVFERHRGGENQWGHVATLHGYANFVSAVDDAGYARNFGSAVLLQGDQLIVGSSRTSVSFTNMNDGAAYVFRRSAEDPDQWDYMSRIIAPGADQCVNGLKLSEFSLGSTAEERIEAQRCASEDINTRHDGFGEVVALHQDLLAVGAPTAEQADSDDLVGAVYLFGRDSEDPYQWNFVRKLQESDISWGANFGSALALSDDTLLVGAFYETVSDARHQGAAYVFHRNTGGPDAWGKTEKLTGTDGLDGTNFGESVALSENLNLVGAHGYLGRRGAVYLHESEVPAGPDDPCSPSFTSTSDLAETGVVTHASGVQLGATQVGAAGAAAVWVHEVPPPAEPLFENAQVLSAFYNVGAECETVAPLDAPFVVALPVPDDADPATLGVAVLAPEGTLVDGPEAGRFWLPVTGSHDAEARLYMIVLGALPETGYTLVLIAQPDLQPVEAAHSGVATESVDDTIFVVQCFGFSSGCDAAEEEHVAAKLKDAYRRFDGQGFPPPALDDETIIFIPTSGFQAITTRPAFKQIYIRAKTDPVCILEGSVLGFYDPYIGGGTLTLCIDPAVGLPPDDELARTVSHELFHAVQFAYDQVRGKPYSDWVVEGMAEVAVESEDAVFRTTDRDLRSVSERLTHKRIENGSSSVLPYEAQDFWVHLLRSTNASGIKRNFNLGVLDTFLQEGATTDSVARSLADPTDLAFDDLGREYWAWVKNQAVEKTDVTLDGVLQDPCRLEGGLVTTPVQFTYPEDDQGYGSLLGLQSELVKITFSDPENPEAPFDGVRVYAEGKDIKYKVYLAQDVDTDPLLLEQACTEIPDGDELGRSFESLPPNATVYVLVSQTSHDEERVPPFYRVAVDREAAP